MFTGIVEAVGDVVSVTPRGETARIAVRSPLAREVKLGESVALNGCCLTIAESHAEELRFDAIRETLEKTALGDLAKGARVNLERAMAASARFDGHIVQGHVDEAGRVREWRRRGADVQLFVQTSRAFADQCVPKGSVTVQGVSLTIVGVAEDGFDVALIPHTLEVTTLGDLGVGARVNLEADVLGKYVRKYLERVLPERRA
ncbi:MAG TPA: riboflavin synthase [Myxococcota bacterium]|nr:riboflavin synthase [Myxococcota bacterium]